MVTFIQNKLRNPISLSIKRLLAFILIFSLSLSPSMGYAQTIAGLNLPIPGAMVALSPAFVPVLLKGMTIHPDNPLQFDFIVDSGNTKFNTDEIKNESQRLVKYFLASMTIPKDDLWVNLSPVEKDRIIPDELGKTELGRDMLAQDYILKQLTATLMYPEKELGKKFWDEVYKEAQEKFGTTEIPVDTFNKVWILPDTATVYEYEKTVYIVEAKLKVMLDVDYVAANVDVGARLPRPLSAGRGNPAPTDNAAEIIREIILPAIEKEVNEGQNFAPLRQIYHSLILAKWYKETIKNSLLSKIYIDQKKIAGVNLDDATIKDKIYAQYMKAYKKGVFNYIKEDYDKLSNEVIPRKYFSGGIKGDVRINRRAVSTDKIVSSTIGENYDLALKIAPQRVKDTIKASSPIDAELEAFLFRRFSDKVFPYIAEGKRVKVYALSKNWVLKVPTEYIEEVYDDDGIRPIRVVSRKVDYKQYIKPGFILALEKIKHLIPEMMEVKDFTFSPQDGKHLQEEWGFIQKRLPITLGERLRTLSREKNVEEINVLRKKYVDYQYSLWRNGVWDFDLNFLDNYGVTKDGKIQLLDIDVLSVTNDSKQYPYNPTFYSQRHRDHFEAELDQIGQDFIRPILNELTVEKFNQVNVSSPAVEPEDSEAKTLKATNNFIDHIKEIREKYYVALNELKISQVTQVDVLGGEFREDIIASIRKLFAAFDVGDGIVLLSSGSFARNTHVEGSDFDWYFVTDGTSKNFSLVRKIQDVFDKAGIKFDENILPEYAPWKASTANGDFSMWMGNQKHWTTIEKINKFYEKNPFDFPGKVVGTMSVRYIAGSRDLLSEVEDIYRNQNKVRRNDIVEFLMNQMNGIKSEEMNPKDFDIKTDRGMILSVHSIFWILQLMDNDFGIDWDNQTMDSRLRHYEQKGYVSAKEREDLVYILRAYLLIRNSIVVTSAKHYVFPSGFETRYYQELSRDIIKILGYTSSEQLEDSILAYSNRIIEIYERVQKKFKEQGSSAINSTNEAPGGIDMNTIDIEHQGAAGGVDIQFDPAQFQEIIDAGIDGFTPVIINITPLPSVLPLLGLDPATREEEREVVSVKMG